MKKIVVIGSGFSGLATASTLAKDGYDVTIVEKNSSPGGRARVLEEEGFTFDMGPTWYWMPDIFENYFARFGKHPSEYYELIRLDPAYRVFFGKDDYIDVPAGRKKINALFESLEKGSSKQLDKFLKTAKYKYETGMREYVWKPGDSLLEYVDWKIMKSALRMKLLSSISKEIRGLFKNPRLIELLEFPVLFLGAKAQNTPSLYSLMNYADLELGTWYPKGGMYEVVKAMVQICTDLGVQFEFDSEVKSFDVQGGKVVSVRTGEKEFSCDVVVASADYHHIEQQVLDKEYRMYNEKYWNSRVMAPAALLFYLGIDKKIKAIEHHNLFFDEDFEQHADDIYENPKWPEKPLFYITSPSISDPASAPKECENLIILIPLAPDLEDSEEIREKYFHIIFDRLEGIIGEEVRSHIVYKRSFCIRDFKEEYNAFKGNAYGLANTLRQTAIMKPKMRNKKLKNFYFAGQLTVPGPGVPPSLISGQLVAQEIIKKNMT